MSTSYLNRVTKPDLWPPIITIIGEPKMGKTTLASTFPSPIFVRVEDGTASVPDADVLPVIQSEQDLWGQLKELISVDHPYKTIVIDSVTKLDRLFAKWIEQEHNGTSLGRIAGGYGVGYRILEERHQRLATWAKIAKGKGYIVVFIAHSKIKEHSPADSDPYQQYDIDMTDRNSAAYRDDSDVIAFIRQNAYVRRDKKGESTGQVQDVGGRILIVKDSASNISGNRYQIEQDFPLHRGENPLLPAIISYVREHRPEAFKTPINKTGEVE